MDLHWLYRFPRFARKLFRGAGSRLVGLTSSAGERVRRHFRIRRYAGASPFPIIGNNCIAGRLCHDLGWQFQSPTVNLWMSVKDFVSLMECFSATGTFPPVRDATDRVGASYPVGDANGKRIHFLHYKTFEEAERAWSRRLVRLEAATERPVLVVSDNSDCSEEDIEGFLALPFKKRMIVHDTAKKALLGECGVYYPLHPAFGTNVSRRTGFTGRWLYQDLVPFSWLLGAGKPESSSSAIEHEHR